MPAGGTLRLKTFSGRVKITGGSGNQLVVHAVRRATRDRLDDIKLEITQSGNTIEVDANHRLVERRNDNVVETDFEIQVPATTRLDIKTFSAPVTVTGVTASQNIDGFSSDITVESADFGDGNDIDVNTFSGNVRLRLPANCPRHHRLQHLQRPLRERPAGHAQHQQPAQLPRRVERRRHRGLQAENVQRRRHDPPLTAPTISDLRCRIQINRH